MTIRELKTWLEGITEDQLDSMIFIRDIKEVEDGKIGQRDLPVALGFVDTKNNKLCFCDPMTAELINKIRANNSPSNTEQSGQ